MEVKIVVSWVFAFLILTLSCVKTKEAEHFEKIQDQWYVNLRDTVLNQKIEEKYIRYVFQGDSTYSIEWGNQQFHKKSTSKLDVLGSGVPGVLDSNEETILLSQSCGTSCTTFIILPFEKNQNLKVFDFAVAYDLKNKLIAYVPSSDSFIRIENFKSGRTKDITEDNACPAASKNECIESARFESNNFVLKWQGKEWQPNKPNLLEKVIPIDLNLIE